MIVIKPILGDGFSKEQATKIFAAIDGFQKVWNSSEFQRRVMKASFSQTNLDNDAIFKALTEIQNKTYMIGLNKVENGSETAATNTVTGITTLQCYWIDSSELGDLVNTLAHEYTHTPEGGSFTHSYLCSRWLPWTRSRPFSVPYQIGDITQEIFEATS